MKTVLVANRKGGCGKTVVAVTLAAALAGQGARVALADADPQRSALRWTKRRSESGAAPVEGLDWSKPEAEGTHPKKLDWLVIDSPGALKGTRAAALVAEAKAVITPVAPSVFDADSTKRFLREIEELKRVRKGKVAIHVLANRVRHQNSRARARLDAFFATLGALPLAWIGDRALYGDLAEEGLSLFDRPQKLYDAPKAQWAPVLTALT